MKKVTEPSKVCVSFSTIGSTFCRLSNLNVWLLSLLGREKNGCRSRVPADPLLSRYRGGSPRGGKTFQIRPFCKQNRCYILVGHQYTYPYPSIEQIQRFSKMVRRPGLRICSVDFRANCSFLSKKRNPLCRSF